MNFEKFKVLGIMSGTSLDGVDFAVVEFECINNKWTFNLKETNTYKYSEEWFDVLKFASKLNDSSLEQLNISYTVYLNDLIHQFISEFDVSNLQAIASHGHTVLHNPKAGFTLQIGNLVGLKKNISIPIICDFRVQDVLFGGQGAPLVPIGDRLLFSEYEFCLNLGGFSNISFEKNNNRIAYDISPVNTVLNYYANQLGLEYDDKGSIASSGTINLELLEKLNSNSFYSKTFPKSLGVEFVFEEVIPIIQEFSLDIKDILRTYVEHISIQIGIQLKNKVGKMIITGGGAFNDYLISIIKNQLINIEVVIPESKIINYKEAIIFAFLGVLKLNNQNNVLSSVTGANADHSSGVIF